MAFRFRNFRVYKDAKELYKEVVFLTNEFPREHFYLADQIRRSALSIILSIAEGSSKQSDKDFNRFIAISLGSIDEVIACLEICVEIQLLKKEQFELLEKRYEALSLQLGAFSKKLKASS